jgi:hypothetical protein
VPAEGEAAFGGDRNVDSVAPGRKCQHAVNAKNEPLSICGEWTAKLPDGGYDQFCFQHSLHPEIAAKRAAKMDAMTNASAQVHKLRPPNTLTELLDVQAKTQDDIALKRTALQKTLLGGQITAANAATLARMIQEESEHIERYGAVSGAEGGRSYMRLLPGIDIVEYVDPREACIDDEDVEKIDAGIAKDIRAGIKPPGDMADIIMKYCGREVRRREKSRYATG